MYYAQHFFFAGFSFSPIDRRSAGEGQKTPDLGQKWPQSIEKKVFFSPFSEKKGRPREAVLVQKAPCEGFFGTPDRVFKTSIGLENSVEESSYAAKGSSLARAKTGFRIRFSSKSKHPTPA